MLKYKIKKYKKKIKKPQANPSQHDKLMTWIVRSGHPYRKQIDKKNKKEASQFHSHDMGHDIRIIASKKL